MTTLDGRTLEGGGQLVRVALTLSTLCRIPIRVHDIRGNRASKQSAGGGLKESHLAALEFLAKECGATVEGGFEGSTEVSFTPNSKRPNLRTGHQENGINVAEIAMKRPGSVWLIFQALLPYIILTLPPNQVLKLILKGGTNVSKSPSGEYARQVLLPVLKKIGVGGIDIQVLKRGWSGPGPNRVQNEVGHVEISFSGGLRGTSLPVIDIGDRGDIRRISVSVLAHGDDIRKLIVDKLVREVYQKFGDSVTIEVAVDEDSFHEKRIYVLIVAETENGWQLGRDWLMNEKWPKNSKALEQMISRATSTVVHQLLQEISKGGCVDEYMEDQLVVFQALASGASVVDAGSGPPSLHTQTVRWVCQEMLGDRVKFKNNGRCSGIGYSEQLTSHPEREAGTTEEAAMAASISMGLKNLKLGGQ